MKAEEDKEYSRWVFDKIADAQYYLWTFLYGLFNWMVQGPMYWVYNYPADAVWWAMMASAILVLFVTPLVLYGGWKLVAIMRNYAFRYMLRQIVADEVVRGMVVQIINDTRPLKGRGRRL